MKLENLKGKRIILFTKKNFRFQGQVKDFDGRFIEILDEVKNKPKMINVDEIAEYEIAEDNKDYKGQWLNFLMAKNNKSDEEETKKTQEKKAKISGDPVVNLDEFD